MRPKKSTQLRQKCIFKLSLLSTDGNKSWNILWNTFSAKAEDMLKGKIGKNGEI